MALRLRQTWPRAKCRKRKSTRSIQALSNVPEQFDWERTSIDKQSENKSWVETAKALETPLDLLEIFLDIPDNSPRHFYEAPEIAAICSKEALSDLHQRVLKEPGGPGIWIDDRNRQAGARSEIGSMTLSNGLRILEQQRYGNHNVPDVDTRRVHIPNPDTFAVATLILVSSKSQVPISRDLLWKHLSGRTSVEVTFPRGGRLFVLQFHQAFFVWKRSCEGRHDNRRGSDGSPLRKAMDLSFLFKGAAQTAEASNQKNYLYEAQTSCVVSGYNNTTWTATCLSDNYFYESCEDPWDEMDISDEILFDPLNMGKSDAAKPIWDPREYFLSILKTWMENIKEHWLAVVARLRQAIETFLSSLAPLPFGQTRDSKQDQSEVVHGHYEWIKQVMDLLTKLTDALSRTIDEWKSFESFQISYLRDSKASYQVKLALHDVRVSVEELKGVLMDLKGIKAKAEDFKKQLVLYLSVEQNRAIVYQQWNVTMVHFLCPPTLAASLIQANVLVFKPFILCFLILSLTIGLMTGALQPALAWYAETRLAQVTSKDIARNIKTVIAKRYRDLSIHQQTLRPSASDDLYPFDSRLLRGMISPCQPVATTSARDLINRQQRASDGRHRAEVRDSFDTHLPDLPREAHLSAGNPRPVSHALKRAHMDYELGSPPHLERVVTIP